MRRPARKSHDQNAPSLDSFLDVVTNLVGILIILIMVVGVTARDALFDAAGTSSPETRPPTLSIAPPEPAEPQVSLAQLNSLASDIASLQDEIVQIQQQSNFAFEERNQLQLLLTAAQKALDLKQEELDAKQRDQVAQQRELLAKTRQLDELYDQIESLTNVPPEVEELAHYPTPLAKTVFGKEAHFRLLGGRVAYVPMDPLVELMKQDAKNHLDRARKSGTATAQVGPINGFAMEYTLVSKSYEVETSLGTASRGGVELQQFVLVPDERQMLGETVDQALQPGSRFREIIASLDPNRTTITVWTYPDSYSSFRALRDDLYEIGFTTAARPLPADYPIGGSPHGQRSSSQ